MRRRVDTSIRLAHPYRVFKDAYPAAPMARGVAKLGRPRWQVVIIVHPVVVDLLQPLVA